MSRSTYSTCLLVTLIALNITLSQAMLPPPMLRAVCSAFADAEEFVGVKAAAAGKAAVDMALKPIAIAGGLKTAAVGASMKVSGGAMKFVGEKMAGKGALLEATGAGVKGAGLGVAALAVKPLAEKAVAAGKVAEGSIATAALGAEKLAKSVGDTSIQIDASIDSPFIGHHHKGVSVTSGFDTAVQQATEQHQEQTIEQHQEQSQQSISETHTISKRAAHLDPEVIKSALALVHEANLEDCVCRAVCDLNCDPQGFGQDGKQVFMNMVRLQGSKAVDPSEIKRFQEAASKGRGFSGKCHQCSSHYSSCKAKSSDLIKMASHIKMD